MNKWQDLSDRELEEALQNKQQVKSIDNSYNDLIKFAKAFNLKVGEVKVKSSILYRIYKRWSKEPIEFITFCRDMLLIIDGSKTFFHLETDTKELANFILKEEPLRRDLLKSPKFKEHFELFLSKHNIVPGSFYINGQLISDLYNKWCKANKRNSNTIGYNNLIKFSKLYFKCKQDFDDYYFAVDSSITNNLSEEQKLLCLTPKGKINALKKAKNKKKSS